MVLIRCPGVQGDRGCAPFRPFWDWSAVFLSATADRKYGGRNLQQFATPPLDQDRGDFPSRADELARRREIHERKCKSGLRKRRENFLAYLHISDRGGVDDLGVNSEICRSFAAHGTASPGN